MQRGGIVIGLTAVAAVGLLMWWIGPWTDDAGQAAGTSTTPGATSGVTVGQGTAASSTAVVAEVTSTVTPSSTSEASPATTTTEVAASSTEARPPVPTTTRPSTAEPPAVEFSSSIGAVEAEDLSASWRPGCPVEVEALRALDVTHWGLDGRAHTGRLIVAAGVADDIAAIMRDLFLAGFAIQRMEPVDVYGGDDDASMGANNTSAFNCRAVTGGSSWSEHSYGTAIDVNPLVNPYVRGSTVLPPEGQRYADRTLTEPGMIHAGDATVHAFADRGWVWGGTWSSPKDYQHFSTSGR